MKLNQNQWLTVFLACLGLVFTHVALAAQAAPVRIEIEYEVYKGNIPFATVKELFETNHQSYQVMSESKGIGVFALLGERKLVSQGIVDGKNGLKPITFKLQQGDKQKAANFDWEKKQLQMQSKGKTRTAELTQPTQDLASFAYQFAYQPPIDGQAYQVALTTGKRLKQYTYQVEAATIVLVDKRGQRLEQTVTRFIKH